MSGATINQKEYLKKYLSGGSGEKKKKKRKKPGFSGRVQIVDDDIDLNNMQPLEDGDYNLYELAEDAPQIVGIVDERPEEVKALEVFRGSKWKIVQDENGIEDIKVTEERTNKSRDVSDERFREFDIVSPVFSDRNRGENAGKVQKKGKINVSDEDSDASPPRKSRGTNSDESPPRKKGSKISSTSDILRRPEERVSRKRDSSPSIRGSRVTGNKNEIDSDDSDISPPRKSNSRSIHNEHERKYSRCNSDSDMSPPRARRKKEDSDESPPRKTSAKCKQDEVFSKKSRFNQDSDESPPRKYRSRDGSDSLRRKPEPPRSKSRVDSDSDESPPRKFPSKGDFDQYHQTSKYHQYSDRPTRKEPINSKRKTEKMFQQGRSDSDEPPLQKKGIVKERLPVNALKYDNRMGKDSSSKKNEKQERTLEGKKAGLQDAKALRMENLEHQLKEKEVFAKMSDDLSGRNAATVMRDRATGKKRDLAREAAEKAVEKEKEDKKKEKYSRWGKGLKQVEDQQSRLHEDLYEMSKPLARYADDQDLESYLKEQEREGDPMQEYIRSQKLKKEKENPSLGGETKKYPVYQGPQPPPNRFGIRPGYRWDGVDRSTGFEQKWFQEQSSRKALQEESYKWSTEDM